MNESNFSFEIYTNRLKHRFDTLRKYNQPMRDREEVEILMKQINTNKTQLTACIQICFHSCSANFNDAATYLNTQIYHIFPDSQPGAHARCGHGHPEIRSHNVAKAQIRNGEKLFNCVNITHIERYFPGKEWNQLLPQ